MAAIYYYCDSPNHPLSKHPREYTTCPQDGFCPDCEYGESPLKILEGPPKPPKDQAGLCILVCDASGSMTQPAFADMPSRRIELVAKSAALGIADNYVMSAADSAYIALIGFGGRAEVLKDQQGRPFVKTLKEIQAEFATAKELGEFMRARLGVTAQGGAADIDPNHTDITKALSLAHQLYEAALAGDLSAYGVEYKLNLLEHHPVLLRDPKRAFTVKNVRVLIYSDGEHYPADKTALASPFQDDLEHDIPSVLMTAYFGDGSSPGAEQMKALACTCPIHEKPGYFLINSSDRYVTLRRMFRMASGASGFCPQCLHEAQQAAQQEEQQKAGQT